MKCATHPDVETNLTCGKCGRPICPRCMVETPVGARCPTCARVQKLPTYQVSTRYYLRATGTALGIGLAAGFAWMLIEMVVPFFFLGLLLGPAVGYAIAEVVGWSVNRKRGRGLAVIGAVAVVLAYGVTVAFRGIPLLPLQIVLDLVAVMLGVSSAVARLK